MIEVTPNHANPNRSFDMADKKTTLTVKVNGTIYTRTTHRKYSHVLIGRVPIKRELAKATTWTESEELFLQGNFKFYQECASGEWWTKRGWAFGTPSDIASQTNATAIVNGGIDAYRKGVQNAKIKDFEQRKERNYYTLQVISWHGSLKTAEASRKTAVSRGWYVDLEISEVGGSYSFKPEAE